MSNQSRRTFIAQSGKLVLGTMIAGHVAMVSADEHGHADSAPATTVVDVTVVEAATKFCVTCEYWGGIRQISEDGKGVAGSSMGWCNNPQSHNYRKMTKPNAGPMIAWKQWGALS